MYKATLLLLVVLAALVTATGEAAADETSACRFTGFVKLNGVDVPDGTVVRAIVGDTEYATTTPTGWDASTYSVKIRPPEGEEYADGTQVRFTVNGHPADQTGHFRAGENFNWDLTATGSSPGPSSVSESSTSALFIALLATACVAQTSAVCGVAYITVTSWDG